MRRAQPSSVAGPPLTDTAELTGAATARTVTPLVAVLAVTQTVGYGVLYYAFSVLLTPIANNLHTTTTTVTGAFTLSIVTTAVVAVPVGRWLDRRGGRHRCGCW